jgi:soluble lytic murein transglycosylase-like protein
MWMDRRYHRDERLLIRIAVIFGVLAGILAFTLTSKLTHRTEKVSPVEVWSYIQEIAPQRNLDPEFVYALAWAESSLNARARSSVARGIMQISKPAWQDVSDESYRLAWDWRTNIRVSIDYLALCRDYLLKHDSFNYQLLAASYRYGPYYVADKDFDLSKIKKPKNEIYQRIFAGNIRPVTPPQESLSP